MIYDIIITVDENDADYHTLNSKISEEDLNIIKPLIEAIKNFKPYKYKLDRLMTSSHNYPQEWRDDLGELSPYQLYPQFSKDVFDLFEKLCPYCEYGFHTIISIEIAPTREVTKLL